METLTHLASQPLFRLIGAIIVLLVTDWNPLYGCIAFGIWCVWIMLDIWTTTRITHPIK